ncbi:MAG: hypothetical protein JWO86_5911 [Myxococcaceae bacterium]|nr:hypothetical protein [Myxococcaceae bacterium]
MTSPYRDMPETVESEPFPQFHPPETLARDFAVMTMLTLLFAIPSWHFGGIDGIVKLLVLYQLPMTVGMIVLVLSKPMGAWLDRRYARKVARGIAELEARAVR